MIRVIVCLIVSLIFSRSCLAQDHVGNSIGHSHNPKSLILYDPLFWKSQLKLSTLQQRKIDKVNIEFYAHIKSAYASSNGQPSSHRLEIGDLLANRSEQIWEIFQVRQKRKWEKMEIVNMYVEYNNRTQDAF